MGRRTVGLVRRRLHQAQASPGANGCRRAHARLDRRDSRCRLSPRSPSERLRSDETMAPLHLPQHRPRGPRETMLGFYLLPRTVDKLRAELPGGHLGEYLNHDTGFSAYLVRRLGLKMDELRQAVARAPDETALVEWLA